MISFNAAVKEFVHPYWDIQEDSELKQQPGLLFSKFREVAINPKVYKGLKSALRSVLPPDAIDDVFVSAANQIPSEDLYEMAKCLSKSETFLLIGSYSQPIIRDVLNTVSERCSQDKKEQVLTIFEGTSAFRKFIKR